MTSMLYSPLMNNLILPEAVQPGRHYSFRADLKLNAWAFVAILVAAMARWVLRHYPGWDDLLRSAIALSPLLPSLLYVQSIRRWIGGMDELQQRIQLNACLFATTGAVFVATALSLLGGVGLLQSSRLQHGLGWEGTFAVIIAFYILANFIVNRRYR
jgi:hypothetical protein